MKPKVIDLFSGCGGLALGFEKAGFEIIAGVELMPEACQTVTYNLDYRNNREATHICGDITEMDPEIFKDRIGGEGCIVIGGPPCQAYSIVGRGKLRSLGDDRVNTKDARGYLYQDFLRFVYGLDARAVIMENVPESTNFGDMNIPEIVCEDLEKNGYKAFWTILNSADYGVPQLRERIFVYGIKTVENAEIKLPVPDHRCTTDYLTYNQRRLDTFSQNPHFRTPNKPGDGAPAWVTVGEALSDLPVLFPTANSRYRSSDLNEELDYRCDAENDFQEKMRMWYGEEPFGITGNAFRNNKRDFIIFEKMNQGDNYTDASRIADELFQQEARMFGYQPDSKEYEDLRSKMVPVYDRDKFENKWKRLEEGKPSHTLVAHLSKDTYSHIHPTEPRGISVREAARIQSFPDDFFFECTMGDAYKQIGNAVPPLLALGVAKPVFDAFGDKQ